MQTPLRLDAHFHMVGNGSAGSGSWLRLNSPLRTVMSRLMLFSLGISQQALRGDLDEIYFQRVLQFLEHTTLDGVLLLAHEQVYDDRGNVVPGRGTMHVPNSAVLSLCRRSPKLFPAVSIHPGRRDALDELDRCIDEGAVALKILPNCQNINCSEPRFKRFWQRMADAGLVLLSHTGGELSLDVVRHEFSDPAVLNLPLECGVTVIAAHAGTSAHYFDRDYTSDVARMLQRHPNLFVDNSGLNTPIRSRHFPKLLREPFVSRTIHGSDVPIPISPLWVLLRRLITLRDYLWIGRAPNPLERDVRIKRALGFGENSFTLLFSLLQRRLEAVGRWTFEDSAPSR